MIELFQPKLMSAIDDVSPSHLKRRASLYRHYTKFRAMQKRHLRLSCK